MYHIFIHSFVDGHLGCFQVLAIVNSAAMNIKVHASFPVLVFSRYMPSSGIPGSYSSSIFSLVFFFFLEDPLYCSPKWLHQFLFPPTVEEGSILSIDLSAFIICRDFDDGHSIDLR